ncbi:hypothetical protein F4604DRAFT_1673830 [Suillus subluteus]|nr:hypothetical protein F4604DRAFT_1673830 [Suillus subluteus]
MVTKYFDIKFTFATVDQATIVFKQLALKEKYCTVLNNTAVNVVKEHKYLVRVTMDSLYECIGKDPKNHSSNVPYETFEMKQAIHSISKTSEVKMDYSEELEDIKVIKDLQGKFEILYLAQYFLDSFYRQAGDNDVHTLSKMRWNITGAFIRKLIRKLADAPKNSKDSCSLIFSVFMVLPLLLTGALCKEIKFSKKHEIVISDIQGIIKPDQTIVFFDPQSHIAQADSGYWD